MIISVAYDIDLNDASCMKILKQSFAPLKAAQQKYEQCDEVDTRRYHNFVSVTLVTAPSPTPAEVRLLASASALLHESVGQSSGYARIRGSLAAHPTLALFIKSRDKTGGDMWGKGVAQVDTTAELALGWLWTFLSYERTRAHTSAAKNLPRSEADIENSRSKIMTGAKKFPKGLGDRIFENIWVWDKMQESSGAYYYVLTFSPASEHEWARKDLEAARNRTSSSLSLVKATTNGVYKIRPIAPNICELTLVQCANFGGKLPAFVADANVAKGLLTLIQIQTRFRRTDRVVDKVRGRGGPRAKPSQEPSQEQRCN